MKFLPTTNQRNLTLFPDTSCEWSTDWRSTGKVTVSPILTVLSYYANAGSAAIEGSVAVMDVLFSNSRNYNHGMGCSLWYQHSH